MAAKKRKKTKPVLHPIAAELERREALSHAYDDGGTTKIADIDVAQAKKMLRRLAPMCRNINAHAVATYARRMKSGEWLREENRGHPILLDSKLRLVNGRHRLLAIVKSGVPLKGVMIVTGFDDVVGNVPRQGNGDFADAVRPRPFAEHKTIADAVAALHVAYENDDRHSLNLHEAVLAAERDLMTACLTEGRRAGRVAGIAESATVSARRAGELEAGARHAGPNARGKLLAQAASEVNLVSDRIRALVSQ